MEPESPCTNGSLLRDLIMPDFRDYAVDVPSPAPLRHPTPMNWASSCLTMAKAQSKSSATFASSA
jgi:phosphoketolase